MPVRRVLQLSPIIFKGSGWYKTDSRAASSNGKTENKSADAAASTDTGEKAEKAEKSTEAVSTKEAVSEATATTTAEIKKTAEKPATPAAAS